VRAEVAAAISDGDTNNKDTTNRAGLATTMGNPKPSHPCYFLPHKVGAEFLNRELARSSLPEESNANNTTSDNAGQ